MDLSKAFDSLNHELLVAKLHAYGFSYCSLKLIFSYLSNRWIRTKISNSFSSCVEILFGVPQGSILGPLFFNIYLYNFADGNTLYACDMSLDALVAKLETSAEAVIKWIEDNCMKLNESKCKLLISDNKEVIIASGGDNHKLLNPTKLHY